MTQESEAPDPQEPDEALARWRETPDYDDLVQERGDPFDGTAPFPEPSFSDLFESHEPLKITDEDVAVRMPTTEVVDTSFLEVTLEDVLAEARKNRKQTPPNQPSTGLSGRQENRKQRRARVRLASSS